MERDVAQILIRMEHVEAHIRKIDDRLEAGDKRFENEAIRVSGEVATRKFATKIGLWLLGVASAAGIWALGQLPALIKWWMATRT